MTEDKPTDAEEIFSEFQQKNTPAEKPSETETLESPSQPESPLETQTTESPPPEPTTSASSETESPNVSTESSTKSDESSERRARNVIFVGTKPIMTYVTATLTQLSSEPTVTIKARGKRITQAVDVSQMIVKRMDSVGYTVSDVRIASDSLTSQDGRMRNVSTIEIDISKT